MAYDPKDDVDRLFACFKCGVSTPESAVRERRLSVAGLKKAPEVSMPSSSKQSCKDSGDKEKHGAYMSAAIKLKSGKQISPIIFYGSPHGAPVKRPSRLLRLLHEIHVDLNEENDFISREGVWATFPRQEEAIRFLKGHAQAKLFSYQDHLSGQRRFLASTYNEFWRRYIGMDSKLRHHYEVIQELFLTGKIFPPCDYSHTKSCLQGQLTCWCICYGDVFSYHQSKGKCPTG